MAKKMRETMSFEFNGSVMTVSDGDTRKHDFNFASLPHEMGAKFLELGRKTKVSNFAASAEKLGRDRLEMMIEGFEQLMNGQWAKPREGGGPVVSAEVEALAQIKGKSVGWVQKNLREYDDATRAKILSNPAIVKLAAKIRDERADADGIDLEDMIGEDEEG